jgi:hypothetical protein
LWSSLGKNSKFKANIDLKSWKGVRAGFALSWRTKEQGKLVTSALIVTCLEGSLTSPEFSFQGCKKAEI